MCLFKGFVKHYNDAFEIERHIHVSLCDAGEIIY